MTKMILAPVDGDNRLKLPPYKFEKASIKDYTSIAHIISLCGLFPELTPQKFYSDMVRSLIGAWIARDKENDRIAGIVTLSKYSGFPTIRYLWVDPLHRRKGIGWALLNICLLRTKRDGYGEIHTYMEDDNFPAQEIFKKAGFKNR